MGECDYSFIMQGLETSLDNKDGPFQFRRFNVFSDDSNHYGAWFFIRIISSLDGVLLEQYS